MFNSREQDGKTPIDATTRRKQASAAAARALAEAAARRAGVGVKPMPKEIDGRDGPDPVRYGDWEVKGLASDF